MQQETREQWAFRVICDAFADLESLAETIDAEDGRSEAEVRLGEHQGLDRAFTVLDKHIRKRVSSSSRACR